MAVTIKSEDDVKKMRVACGLAANVLEMVEEYVLPGTSTNALNEICHAHIIQDQNAISACLGYRGFPKSICTSVNQVVCHGIPSEKKILRSGDIINVDITVIKDGWHGDTSRMFLVGEVASFAKRLVQVSQECLYKAINLVAPGVRLGDIGYAIQEHAENNHYSIVREYCGHGIGKVFHEEPQVLHYGAPNTGLILEEGMIFTIEPMLNAGRSTTKLKRDGWTVETSDGRLSSQWEHTILVTRSGCEVLTMRNNESI